MYVCMFVLYVCICMYVCTLLIAQWRNCGVEIFITDQNKENLNEENVNHTFSRYTRASRENIELLLQESGNKTGHTYYDDLLWSRARQSVSVRGLDMVSNKLTWVTVSVPVTVILFKCPKNTSKRPRGLPLDIRLSRLHLELPYMQNVLAHGTLPRGGVVAGSLIMKIFQYFGKTYCGSVSVSPYTYTMT